GVFLGPGQYRVGLAQGSARKPESREVLPPAPPNTSQKKNGPRRGRSEELSRPDDPAPPASRAAPAHAEGARPPRRTCPVRAQPDPGCSRVAPEAPGPAPAAPRWRPPGAP